ncbi:MAG: hypothetical protein D6687_10360 [Acidobacteria bacterium]|jgi:hypothetical protein|nr:MAG: hypothetical protein D6687_10360 [Acidobacteriota bacterium]GIU81133.1 MAG: hypothetical protein KatS3mg006_0197 [Pyrinomonadaceae bacterium]
MGRVFLRFLMLCFLAGCLLADGYSQRQHRRQSKKKEEPSQVIRQKTLVVIDERLSVIRDAPSPYAFPIQRMRRGRVVVLKAVQNVDGVKYYQIQAGNISGWVQSDAFVIAGEKSEEMRLLRLIQGSKGFDKIERVALFLKHFPNSDLRSAALLLFGDLLEEAAENLSKEASRRLDQVEMRSSSARIESFYLNYSGLDRYRRLGAVFLFNPKTKSYHYDGQAWKEILDKYPNSQEAKEAKQRMEALKQKMEQPEN